MTQHDTLTLEQAVFAVLEGFTLPHDVRKVLEAAHYNRSAISATQPAQAAQPVSRDVIRDVFLRNGFTIKDGCSDLKPYVYAAANALLEVAAAQPVQGVPEVPQQWFNLLAEARGAAYDEEGYIMDPDLASAVEDIDAMLTSSPTPPAQQPSGDVVRDAERYRFLAERCRSASEHWRGRWWIVIDGPAPKSHDSEDDFDDAIDAALTAQEQATADHGGEA